MHNHERPIPREFTALGQGIETTAYRANRGSRDSAVVLKGYDQTAGPGFAKAGFDRAVRDRLLANHTALQQVYGDVVARQRFLTRRNLKTERYKLVQEYIDKAKPASVLDYPPAAVPPEALNQLRRVTALLVSELTKALAQQDAVLLDTRNRNNLVVSTDGTLYYLDTGLMNKIAPGTDDYFVWKHRLAPLALMQLVAGESVDAILAQPLLAPLFTYLETEREFDRQRASADAAYMRQQLEQFYK